MYSIGTLRTCVLQVSKINRPSLRAKFLLLLVLGGGLLLAMHATTNSAKSKSEITVQAAGRGKPYFNLQDGRELQLAYRGEESLTTALRSGQAQARSLASIDLDRDGTPDVLAGYSYNGAGLLTLQRGNPDAFAPKSDDVFVRLNQGYNPDSLLPTAEVVQIPEAVDFLQVGDFNHDNQRDVLVAANGGGLFLLAGDGQGGLGAPEQIALSGGVTAMAAGEFRAPDGWTDVAVGVNGADGPQLLIFDGANGVAGEPMRLKLTAPATAVEFGEVDPSPFLGVAVATGNQIELVHGWGRKQSPTLESRVETVDAGGNVRGLAVGFFIWNREGSKQLAALGEDGTIRILQRGQANTQPLSDAEITERARLRLQQKKTQVDVEAAQGWQAAQAEGWNTVREVVTGNVVGADATSQNLLLRAHVSFVGTDDLMVLGANQQRLDIVRQVDATAGPQANVKTTAGDMVTTSLNTIAAPATALALPQKLNGERSLLLLQAGSASPTVVPLAPTATIVVDRTDDTAAAAASACTGAANDCSLRGAIQFANANPGTVITLATTTYVLNINGANGCVNEPAATGNTIGDLEVNASTTFNGNGAANTIIRQGAATNDRVLCMDVPLTSGLTFAFSGMTITGGRDVNSNVGGGGFIGGARDVTTNLTNVTFANNQTTGPNISGGGGVAITGGSMTITSCTFGAANLPGANRNDLTLGNASNSNSAGGLSYSPGDPAGVGGATGTLTVTGNTFTHNTSSSGSAGGGGLDVFNFNTSTGTANISTSSFTSNQATGTASGGGINNESLTNVNISTTSFTSNSAGNRGGGVYVGGGAVLLDGTSASITFTSNTATSGGSSVSTASALNVSGTNTSIGGAIEVTTNGTWTNNAGSTLAPTNVVIVGGTFTCNNSTMNVGGDLTLGPGAVVGGTFNGNTGTVNIAGNFTSNSGGAGPATTFNANTNTFNFNGGGAQSISGSLSPTFNNLTVNKGGGTLTLNVNAPVAGNLTVTAGTFDLGAFTANRTAAGGTLTVSNGATLKIGGPNTLPSNYTTHSVGATSTIEYSGTNQTVATLNSSQKYGNLIISGSGTKTLQGAISIATALTINAGTLDASASNFNIDDAGSWTNNVAAANFNPRAATVTFSSGAQNINGSAASQTFNNVTMNDTSLTVGGSTTTLTLNGAMLLSAGTFSAGTATNINIAGNWTNNINAAAFTPGAGTVTFNSTTAGQTINGTAASQTFNNLTVSKTGQILNTGGSTTQLDLNGAFNLTAGTFTAPATLNLAGDWTEASGTTFTPGAGTVTFNSSGARNLNGTAATQTFNNLVINKSGGGSVTGGGSTTTLTINGGVTLTAGTFTAGTVTAIGIAGDWTNNGGTFTPGTSTVTFNNTAATQTITGTAASQTFNNLTVSKTGQILNTGGSTTQLDLNGNFSLSAGTFTAPATVNVAGDWTQTSGTTFTPGSGTVNFNSTGTPALNGTAATQTFNNLTINKTGGGSVTGGGSLATLNLNGAMTLTAGTFSANTITAINLPGNWTNNGGTFFPGSTNVTFNNTTAAQSINGSAASQQFFTMTMNKAVQTLSTGGSTTTLDINSNLVLTAGTFTAPATMTIAGNFTQATGTTFTPGAGTVTFDGNAAQSIDGTLATKTFFGFGVNKAGGTLSPAASTTALDINGGVTLTAGTFAAGTATAITVAGNWTNNGGTFTPGVGTETVTFDGAAGQTIGGTTATTFNNLTDSDAGGIAMNNDNTVNGILALTSSDVTVAATKTLTQPVAGSSTGAFDVNGRVQRTGFVTGGAALSFGNPFNSIQVTAGTAPANIVVDLARSVPTGTMGYPTAVQRTYTITPSAAGFTGTLRLHYLPGELNSNDPTLLNLWRFDSGITAWRPNPATSRDCASGCTTNTSSFWTERSGVTTFSPWTLNSTNSPTAAGGVVTGRIVDSNGAPVEGAVVKLSGTQNRKFITDANGFYRFDNVETNGFYIATPSRANYTFSPSSRSFSQIGETTDAAFGATLTSGGFVNPLDTPEYFVRQHYIDFLGREPDEAGFNFWSDQILECGADTSCSERRRENVSAAYFLSIEFQQTGGLVDGLYRASYGARPQFAQFMPDTRAVGLGVVVGRAGWEAKLEANKQAFIEAFVNRPTFHAAYDGLSSSDYVDALISHAGVSFTAGERDALVSGLANGTLTRSAALRSIAENQPFVAAKFNEAFVIMEYFGYLRRDPDESGYAFWLNKLNQFGGNFEQAEMVKAFIVSGEFRDRFPR